jgi:hypothetical protein
MKQGHIFFTIKDLCVTFAYANRRGTASGSNPHDGSVVDAEMQIAYFLDLFKPKTQEIHFEML